jgi:bifunctional N-acetylglucosamine-1-phosphate-uridyltransferase/glucosamine-1-phosphate-acetyltransferase GlmU-like protein
MQKKFHILHDNHKIKCVIGLGTMAQTILGSTDYIDQFSFEHIMSQPASWIQQRQFIVATSDIKLKKNIVEYLDKFKVNYFSLVSPDNNLHSYDGIGQGTWINSYNELLSEPIIKDHCIITSYCQLGHNIVINNFCHISAYSYMNNVSLGQGTVLGLRTSVIGSAELTSTPDFCNFIINSVVTKNLIHSGTYFGNKKISDDSSLTKRIL